MYQAKKNETTKQEAVWRPKDGEAVRHRCLSPGQDAAFVLSCCGDGAIIQCHVLGQGGCHGPRRSRRPLPEKTAVKHVEDN